MVDRRLRGLLAAPIIAAWMEVGMVWNMWSRSLAIVPVLALACGDDGGTASTSGSSGGSSSGGATTGPGTTGAPGTSGEPTPTTGGSQSATGSSSGAPDPTTGAVGVTETTGDGTTTTGDPGSSTGDASGSSSGDLVCEPPLAVCEGACVSLDFDPEHCGGCDLVCANDQVCVLGECTAVACEPKSIEECFDGPPEFAGVGACAVGQRACNELGTGYGPCEGDVLPTLESCETPEDDDCDGKANEGCFLANCLAIKMADPDAPDGPYAIDLDGDDGPLQPFQVLCDMTIAGGGWTRFNWLHTEYVAGLDPLGQALPDCKFSDLHCRGRIPAGAVTGLLVKDLTDKAHAVWTFNGSTISNAVLGALQSKQEYCNVNQGAFQPTLSTSAEAYCGNGQEGGCDSFFYTSGACKGVGNWGIHWDGDNAWCAAAFKMGATFGGCGSQGDQGFLNECACDDEQGELYYR